MSDLPGFVRDPVTGRYYRKGGIGVPDFVQRLERAEKIQLPKEKEWSFSTYSKSFPSVPSAISLHQNGLLSRVKYGISALQSKLQKPNIISIYDLEGRNFQDVNQLVKNSGKNYYVVGRNCAPDSRYEFHNTIDQFNFSFHKNVDNRAYVNCSTSFISPDGRAIQDVNDIGGRILFIANSGCPRPNSRSMVGLVSGGSNFDENSPRWYFSSLLRCCGYDKRHDLMVIGTADSIIRINPYNVFLATASLGKDVFSIAPNWSHNVIYACHDGNIHNVDFRSEQNQRLLKLKSSVICIKVLKTGHEFIASGYDHELCLIDCRMNRVSRRFHQHFNECGKIPFSYCDSNKLLCSAGQDNKVRVWSLHHSSPLTTLEPTDAMKLGQRFCFLSAKNRSFYLHSFYENEVTTYDLML